MPQATAPERPASEERRSGEPGLVAGRPVEDRTFEAVETTAGAVIGLAIGSAIAGPVGAAVGAAVGGAVGLAGGEAFERAEGQAARTTDAETDRPPS